MELFFYMPALARVLVLPLHERLLLGVLCEAPHDNILAPSWNLQDGAGLRPRWRRVTKIDVSISLFTVRINLFDVRINCSVNAFFFSVNASIGLHPLRIALCTQVERKFLNLHSKYPSKYYIF